MLKNYFKIALRNLQRNKTFSVINILGFAVGIAACVLILLYVQHEFSFDKFNGKYKRIYRTAMNIQTPQKNMTAAITSSKLGPFLKANFPEVKNYVRVYDIGIIFRQLVRYKNKTNYSKDFMFADSNFFTLFSYPLLEGDKSNVLSAPFSVVITKSKALEYFGNKNPIGKRIQLVGPDTALSFTITGIADDPPANSTLQFNFLASYSTLYTNWWKRHRENVDNWGDIGTFTYVLLNDNHSIQKLKTELSRSKKQLFGNAIRKSGLQFSIFFQELKDIHLYSHLDIDLPSNVNAKSLYILSAIAFFLLLIACVNFMNLSTAKHIERAKEISVRKVLGAARGQLMKQFLSESVALSIISTIIAVVLIKISLPFTKTLTGTMLSLNQLNIIYLTAALLGIMLLTGLIAGIYPAIFLSSFEPVSILKKTIKSANLGNIIRKSLVVFQFTISIALIISAFVVQKQLRYIQNSNIGFNKKNLIVIPLYNQLGSSKAVSKIDAYKSVIEGQQGVIKSTAVSEYPGFMVRRMGVKKNSKGAKSIIINTVFVDSNYIKTLGLQMKSGRSFSGSNTHNTLIINESAARLFGLTDPVGKYLISLGIKNKIIGVIKNFNFESLHSKVKPLVLAVNPNQFNYLICRINPNNIKTTLKFLKEKWNSFYPGIPFDYSFLDTYLDRLYVKDERLGGTVNIFTVLAIIIACLGLFGLASFSVEERTKEIGIRKVLGASTTGVVKLLSIDFIKLVLLANIIAWPLAYYFMTNWLQNFAYRTDVNLWIFLLSGGTAFFISAATISIQAVKAATANPVESLRYE